MSFKNINTKMRSDRGFTIVELLIVIVVIGILAAITIVSFNGVTAKANATSAKAAANSALKKAEAYNARDDNTGTGYPANSSSLVSTAAQTQPYGLTGVAFLSTDVGTTAPAKPNYLKFYSCANNAGTQVAYYDFAASTPAWTPIQTGTCTTPTFVAGAQANS